MGQQYSTAPVILPSGVAGEHIYEAGMGWRVEILPSITSVNTPTKEDVINERARRLALGFNYTFPDSRGTHHIGTTEDDWKGWRDVEQLASAMIATGNQTEKISISTDTGGCQVTAMEWQQIMFAASIYRQPIWLASFGLQAMDQIPGDYADDKYWRG